MSTEAAHAISRPRAVTPLASRAWPARHAIACNEGWRRTLEWFGVPFIACERDGTFSLSAAAESLVAGSANGTTLMAQAICLARAAAAESVTVAVAGQPMLLREVASATRSMMLGVHLVHDGGARRTGVVVLRPLAQAGGSPTVDGLTPREREVAALIAIGRPTKEIAAALSISTHTARHHTERVFAKLGVQTRAAVAAVLGQRETGHSSHSGAIAISR